MLHITNKQKDKKHVANPSQKDSHYIVIFTLSPHRVSNKAIFFTQTPNLVNDISHAEITANPPPHSQLPSDVKPNPGLLREAKKVFLR